MAQQQSLREDEARQISEETAVIEHLVHIFHPDRLARTAPYCLCSKPVFERIRRADSRTS